VQRYLVGWIILLLVLAPIGGGVSGVIQAGSAAVPTGTNEANTTNATVMPHQHPDAAIDDGDPAQVVSHVDEDLTELLLLSAERLRERDYDGAQTALGPEYQRLLDQYEAAGGAAAGTFDASELSQREAIVLAQRYEATRDRYTTALANDDEAAAREAARELQTIANDVNVTAQELSGNYEELDQVVDQDLSELSSAAETVSDRIARDAENIATNELEETTLTIAATNDTAAFADPVQINGTLTTTDGTPVANETIQLQFSPEQTSLATTRADGVAPPTLRTPTDANGTFTVQYRPVQYPRAAETLRVTYAPDSNAVYLSAADTTPLTISEQANTSVAIETAPSTTRFGDTVEVTGTAAIHTPNGTDTAAVPIDVALGQHSLGTVMTTENGTFSLNQSLPATIQNGTRNLAARLALADSAVASAVNITTVQVAATETELTLETELTTITNTTNTTATDTTTTASPVNTPSGTEATPGATDENTSTPASEPASAQVRVRGTLTTANGTAVAGQPVTLSINDTERQTSDTTENGTFTATLSERDRDALADGTALVAAFDGDETNLASTTTTTIPFPAAATDQSLLAAVAAGLQANRWQVLVITSLLSGVIGLVGWSVLVRGRSIRTLPLIRRFYSDDAGEHTASTPTASPEPTATASQSSAAAAVTLVDDAAAIHTDDPTAATRMAYTALRIAISGEATDPAEAAQTHWEFYRAHRDTSTNPDAFRTLTEAFEHARFADAELTPDEAETAVTAARQLVESDRRLITDGGSPTDSVDGSIFENRNDIR